MSLHDDLAALVRGEVLSDDATLTAYSTDASLYRVRPAVVVRPRDAADISALVKYAATHPGVSLTPRAAGTCMSGGPLTQSVVVDVMAHMNRVLEVGEGYAITEPGVLFKDFDAATRARGYELPSYTASRYICAVGGMVGNNAGGEKHLKYGKTDAYVEEVEAVMADGSVRTYGRGTKDEFTLELSTLLTEHRDLIAAHRPEVRKNSSGYALWDLDPASPNIARLMTGAQGTLGILTKIKFRLVQPKAFSAMAVIFIRDLHALGALVPSILAYQPDSFESYDDHTFTLATRYFFEFAQQMKANLFSIGISFLPEVMMALLGGVPKLVLLAEFRADTQEAAVAQAEKLAADLRAHVPHISVRVARSERAARKYWVIRRESFNLLRKKIRGKRTAPFIDDFVVPPAVLSEFLPRLEKILGEYRFLYTIAGHVGDGNFHIIPLIDPKDPTMRTVIETLSRRVYDLVLEYRGSITGEHNDGYVRTPFVEQMFGHEMYELFGRVKRIFDPQGIFNPGKKYGLTFAEAARYLDISS
ncbi:FAD-binding oxidoreductase [Patescibacteria group bacterium]|nr:FAD-binding oxidoreductase [Patescibacteria group bacterium]